LPIVLSLVLAPLMTLTLPSPASAQAFADAKKALVDYTKSDIAPRSSCESLGSFKSDGLAKIEAKAIAAAAGVPAHCRVGGTISPEIAFEVNLPAMWNGRFYMIGNGGLAGEDMQAASRTSQRDDALKNGFVMAQTNTGHDAAKEQSGTFVLSNPQKAIDYAYRAVHETTTMAKKIAKAYYDKAPQFSYWNSCSNGGRQGLIEAQRYPEDYDGVIANAPWVNQTGFTLGAIWNQQAVDAAPLSAAKLALVATAVRNKCDGVDGLKDGLIDDPRACRFDPARDVPACRAGQDGADCLTPAQAAAFSKIYSGPVSRGKPLFPGYMPGSETLTAGRGGGAPSSNWSGMIVPQGGRGAADFGLAEGILKYLVFDPPKPDYDYKTFDFDKDAALLDRWGKIANANNPDLSAFNKRGGKLIMTNGWADPILQPMGGVNYYEDAVKKNGSKTTDFLRLFMVPGMSHCSGGIGPDQHDPVTAVINWVEKGKAPDQMVASRIVNGKVERSRPLCAYPKVARYTGSGSIDDAANFRCEAPKR
jgi:feruloyl esterase